MSALVSSLRPLELVICCGSGGVGKTTTAAALGIAIASKYEKRTLVVTVDPARRLATALGITQLDADPVAISPALLRRAGAKPKGDLSVCMLNDKTTWDRLVERYAPSPEVADKLFKNRFYAGVSEAFVGSHEFVAMEELFELHRSGEYDCIVVDTPPSRGALDFLEAPMHFSDFVGGKLLAWLASGSRLSFRAFNLAARPFLAMADRLIGSEVLDELADFVRDLRELEERTKPHAKEIYRLMRSPACGVVVVSTLEPAPFAEAEFFIEKLNEFSIPLRGLIVNRVLPEFLADPALADMAQTLSSDETLPAWLQGELGTPGNDAALVELGEVAGLYHRLGTREARQRAKLEHLGKVPLVSVPLMVAGVDGLEGLVQISKALTSTD